METRSAHSGRAPMKVRIPFAASSVAAARRELHAWMQAEGFGSETIEDGRLVVSELVGNSVRHARPLSDGTILVSWRHDRGGIRVSVTDGGSGSRPHAVRAPVSALSGRGMSIVEALAADWWAERGGSRSTIHALVGGA